MRILILANGAIGAGIARAIASQNRDEISVVAFSDSSDYQYLASMGLDVQLFSSYEIIRNDFLGKVDLGLLAWWPSRIPEFVISTARLGFVNAHPSLLPYGRGKDPNFWALVEGSPFGVSVHRVTKEIDAGPVVVQKQIDYDWTDTGGSLYEKAKTEISLIFTAEWEMIKTSMETSPISTPDYGITSAISRGHLRREMLAKSILDLDQLMSVRDILNLLRAKSFPMVQGCTFEEEGCIYSVDIKITKVERV